MAQETPAADPALAPVARLAEAWNSNDPAKWGDQFWEDSRFVNILAHVLPDRAANVAQHARIWSGHYNGTRLAITIAHVRPLGPDHRLVEVEAQLSGVTQPSPTGAPPPPGGVLNTRFAQVLERRGREWRILFAQNTVAAGRVQPASPVKRAKR